jgi:Bacterial RNA polymerase, alpha chain C terminal domain
MVATDGASLMSLFTLALLAVVGMVAKKAIELVLENEYASWASALARVCVRCAGFVCRSRKEQWWADLQYEQRVERTSGLLQATSCIANAPFLALRETAKAIRARRRGYLSVAAARAVISYVESERSIEKLGLSNLTAQALRAHRLLTVDQLLSMREEELLRIRNFGRTALDEVKEKIVAGGFIQPS